MVTVTSVSVEPDRPTLKPTRSMTHPLRDPQAGKRRPKQGEPFDPVDLSRRLEAHLAEQKALSERRRAERKAKEAAAQKLEGYHHVPKMAATSFARTATPDALRQVHRLSEHALKQQLEASPLNDPITGLPLMGIQRVQAMDQVILKSEVLKARNQFQWTRDMEEAAEADVERDINKPVRRTFSGEFSHLLGQKVHKTCRPLSTGDIFSEADEDILVTGKPRTKIVHDANDHRNDWAQRDENQAQSRRTVKDRVSPFLRKRDSVWILKGKKEKTKTERDEAVPTLGFFGSPPDVGRASKGFLARFKRHPS